MIRRQGGESVQSYRYTECGLDNVVIDGVEVQLDDHGEDTYSIRNILGLHKVIAHAIISRAQNMTGAELRFLRSEMGFTQEQLAKLLSCDRVTISRWERGETTIDAASEMVVKLLAAEKLEVDRGMSVEQMARRADWAAEVTEIRIDGSNPANYRLAA